jgi:hypothetical protein
MTAATTRALACIATNERLLAVTRHRLAVSRRRLYYPGLRIRGGSDPGAARIVIVGRLQSVDGDTLVLGEGIRLRVSPGLNTSDLPIRKSVTIVALRRDGVIVVESVRVSREQLGGTDG